MIWRQSNPQTPAESGNQQPVKRFVDWRVFGSVMTIAVILAFGFHRWIGLNFWACLALVVFAILVNGLIAAVEDELPGGFNNPKPDGNPDKLR